MFNSVTPNHTYKQIEPNITANIEHLTPNIVEPEQTGLAQISDASSVTDHVIITEVKQDGPSGTVSLDSAKHTRVVAKASAGGEFVDVLTPQNSKPPSPPSELSRVIQELNHSQQNKADKIGFVYAESGFEEKVSDAPQNLNIKL